jgi:hypothetical protein
VTPCLISEHTDTISIKFGTGSLHSVLVDEFCICLI